MKINSYNNKEQYLNVKEQADISAGKKILNNKEETKNMQPATNIADSIEISEIYNQMASIKNKIEVGFYDNPNILKRVAEKILNQINKQV